MLLANVRQPEFQIVALDHLQCFIQREPQPTTDVTVLPASYSQTTNTVQIFWVQFLVIVLAEGSCETTVTRVHIIEINYLISNPFTLFSFSKAKLFLN